MHLARLAGLDHDADAHARALADRGDGAPRRWRAGSGIGTWRAVDAAIGQDEDRVALGDRRGGAPAELVERRLEPVAAGRRRGRASGSVIARSAPSSSALICASSSFERTGLFRCSCAAVERRLLEEVLLGADGRLERHDQLLADRVDRRVGHLGEELLEVVEQQLRPVGQARRAACRCPSSRRPPGRSAPSASSGCAGPRSCSRRPAGGRGACRARTRAARRAAAGRSARRVRCCVEPLAVRLARRHRLLDLVVADDAALLGVDQEHAARAGGGPCAGRSRARCRGRRPRTPSRRSRPW